MDDWIKNDDIQKYIELVQIHNEEFTRKHGHQPVVYTHTFGCQQNVSDGEKINGMLAEMGFQAGSSPELADLVLYNTCAVRENAEDRIFGNVGALKAAKRRNPGMVIALCGCMVQQAHIAEKIKKSFPYVDLVFGTHALSRFPELLHRKLSEGGRVFETSDAPGSIAEDLPVRRDGTVKAWLPIMYGCDNFCTYCVVPFVRGRERSRKPDRILEEARGLIAEGYREITLLGQNVNSYGKGLEEPLRFAQLLERLAVLEGDFRIRFMTSHPKDCTRELIDVIAAHEKICNHIHLPVQSGSDRILRAMNRHYTAGEYLELIGYAKKRIPGVTFTSDIIVGFPGETEEDFAATLRLVEQVEYQSLFTFLYSRREGTKAADMEDSTPREEKTARFQRLLDLQKEIGFAQYQKLVGRSVRVLVEGAAKSGGQLLAGRTDSNIITEFPAPAQTIGQFVDVRVEQARYSALLGELVR